MLITDELLHEFNIPKDLATIMLPYIEIKSIKNQSVLVEIGDICNSIYFVGEGALIQAAVNENDGSSKAINFHTPQFQPFATISESYFNSSPAATRLLAIKNSTIIVFNKKDTDKILQQHPNVLKFYMERLNETLVHENNFRRQLLTYSAQEFYQYLVKEHASLIQQIPTKYIAEFMGISREWLSKLKSNA